MPDFEMSFGFERGAVRLADGSVFVPMKQGVERWVLHLRPSYAIVGPSFHVLYRLNVGHFVLVQYECCDPAYHGLPVEQNFWTSQYPPRAQVIDDAMAANWLLNQQMSIPDNLLAVLSRPKEKPASRPLSFWVELGLPGHDVPMLAHEIDRIAVSKNLHQHLVRAVNDLRAARGAAAFTSDALEAIGRLLFDRYVVVTDAWWGSADAIPPSHVTIVELNWGEREKTLVASLRALSELLLDPLACQAATRMFGTKMVPTEEERQIGLDALQRSLPEIEELTIALGKALKHVESEPESLPQPRKKASPKRGSRAANIEKLEKELIEHIVAAKSYAIETRGATGVAELLPRPLYKELGECCGLGPDVVTRCFQDETAQQLNLLYEAAGNVEAVLRFGRARSRST